MFRENGTPASSDTETSGALLITLLTAVSGAQTLFWCINSQTAEDFGHQV